MQALMGAIAKGMLLKDQKERIASQQVIPPEWYSRYMVAIWGCRHLSDWVHAAATAGGGIAGSAA